MKHHYMAHRHAGKKPLPSRTDNQLREQLIHAGLLRPASKQESPCTKDRPFVKASH
jgi:hypothetical protein